MQCKMNTFTNQGFVYQVLKPAISLWYGLKMGQGICCLETARDRLCVKREALICLLSRTAATIVYHMNASAATSSTLVESCSFEELNICGMIQGPSNKWKQRMAVTAGPQTDFTTMGECKGRDILLLCYTYSSHGFGITFYSQYIQCRNKLYFLFASLIKIINYILWSMDIAWLKTILEYTVYFILWNYTTMGL